MIPALNEVLQYKNDKLLARYTLDFKNNKLAATDALNELLKYFWLTQKHRMDKNTFPNKDALQFDCAIHKEMAEIDDMWHTFLLFTQDYMQFCKQYFDTYIHHIPTADEEKMNLEVFELNFTRYLSYIYDNLGESTVLKWFAALNQE